MSALPLVQPRPLPYRVLQLDGDEQVATLAVYESPRVIRLTRIPYSRCPTEVLRAVIRAQGR